MYFGHIGVGFAAKTLAPRVSIGVLLIAATALDLLAGVFIILGFVSPVPGGAMGWSHGLFMAGVWSAAAFVIAILFLRAWKPALVTGLLVFSHWVLDFISHPMGMGRPLPPDLPLFFDGSPLMGLGLYNHSIVIALVTDLGLLAAGLTVYFLTTRPVDKKGTLALWILIASLALFPLVMVCGMAGSIIGCFVAIILLPLGLWMDRHRRMTTGTKAEAAGPLD